VVEPQGCKLDGRGTWPQAGGAAARLGSAEGDRLVDPGAPLEEPEIGFARGGHRIQKKLADAVAGEAAKHPGKPIEVFATDEHRIGLKPVTRRVWAPVGERPIAHGHHRFDWLYVTAFASPATGETFWYLSNGVSKEFFEALLETFAREAEAGFGRIILLVLDNAGWHSAAGLKIPDGIRLVYLPPYSPELQPAETLWALVDEPIVNKHIATIEELDAKIANQCIALAEQPKKIQTRTGFHWWPKLIIPN
jgi:transposase